MHINDEVPSPSPTTKAKKPKSLWTQLLGADDDDEEEDEEEEVPPRQSSNAPSNEDSADLSGIQLLGQHLAKVKLQAEERDHEYRKQISQLEREKREQSKVLGESQDYVLQLEAKVKELEMQMTKKWQIEYRDNWIAQVDTLKQEKKKLKEENEQMRASIASLAQQQEEEQEPALFAKTLNDLTLQREANESLRVELEQVKQALAQSEKTCLAFKSKLDKELELKWELSKRNHWEEEKQSGSIIDSIVQVVAPRPSD